MSWFQSTGLSSFAKTALKEAQKTIDKALDIKEEEDGAGNASNRTGASGRAAAVTDMASEFFAAWGVAGITSSTKDSSSMNDANSSGDGASSSSSSDDIKENQNRAISTPPKRSSTVDDLLLLNLQTSDSSTCNGPSLTSDVPVTLFYPGTEEPKTNDREGTDVSSRSVSSKHTRSLSDTVFHASDDSNSLGDLVQVLDDTSTVAAASPHDQISFSQPCIPSSPNQHNNNTVNDLVTFSQPEPLIPENLIASDDNVVSSTSSAKDTGITKNDVKGNVELLQEIDLDSAGGVVSEEASEQVNLVSGIVISTTDSNNIVESSGLSDGWDWAASTDSCLGGGTNEDTVTETETEPSKDELDASSSAELSAESSDTLVPEQETTAKQQIDECIPSSPPPPSLSPPPSATSPKLIQSSSRPSSPLVQESGVGESTPPSSARVSPNFEMVSSGCCAASNSDAGSGGALPESSRSSSIVVVSGRESTLNSRGTSGAGSSGSSEGGHDIVDGEVPVHPPHSPAVVASSGYIVKHKKAASSSSSSDIEVIPSDYSSSSSALPPNSNVQEQHSSKFQSSSDMTTQTDLVYSQNDREVQTEVDLVETADPAKPVDVDPKDISKYVSAEIADLLAEKDQEANQLREEGEKLSIKQFELSQVIKKLRSKEKETEGVVKGLRTEIATKNLELEKLMKTFISKEGIEQSQNDTISKLNQERRRLELKVEQLHSELEDATDNVESMKATVENASIEILELKNVISSVQRESAEVDRLTRDKGELISRTESLQKEVDHLRSALNSSQGTHHSRESELKSQISTLTQKVHQLETSLADISSEVADATMPLSLEIEKLQSELKHQVSQSDRREQVMQSTISDLEVKLKTASDRERSAKELQIQFQSQHSTLELRIEELEAQNRSLQEQLQQKEEMFGKKLDDKVSRCQKLEKTVERLTGEVEKLANENDSLSNELKAERNSLEIERRRISQPLIVDSRDNNNFAGQGNRPPAGHLPHHQRSSSMSTTSSSTTCGGGLHNPNSQQLRNPTRNDNSREHSPSEHSITSEEASYLDEVFDPNSGMMIGGGNGNNRSMTPKSFFESFSSAGLIENLQSQLRQRESEVMSFQDELGKNEKIRRQLNEEIANLTMQNQQIGLEMEKLGEMEQRLADVEKNYNAVLQMYGEKVEEADELRMDLDDVKEMYKAQIETLLKKS